MEQKPYNNLGKFILIFSIICSLIAIFLSFKNGNFVGGVSNSSFAITILFSISCILAILNGISMKKSYPKYYKYQVISGVILLSTLLIFDIIPRIINMNA